MIRVEQLVYGTFTFTQGFTLVSRSDGITAELAQQAVDACKSWGEILTPEFGGALYHVIARTGDDAASRDDAHSGGGAGIGASEGPTHLVGKVLRHGVDAGGRMAWFHQVLAIPHDDYLQGGADLFAYDDAGFFRDRWFEGDQCAALTIDAGMLRTAAAPSVAPDRVAAVSTALAEGASVRIVAQRATKAVRELMRGALATLPAERRAEVSVATLVYRPVRRYDLWCLYEAGGEEPQRVEDVVYRIERAGE
jgi:hypothetical protein